MTKKFSKMSLLLWILLTFVVLFFVFGVGRREGFRPAVLCSSRIGPTNCTTGGCSWKNQSCSKSEYLTTTNCIRNGGTWTNASCS